MNTAASLAMTVAVAVVLLVACQSSDEGVWTPPISTPPPSLAVSLDADDRAVLQAMLDDFLRPEQQQSIERGRIGGDHVGDDFPNPLFLIFDHSVPVCEEERPQRFLPGCIHEQWLQTVGGVSVQIGRGVSADFKSRNGSSVPIADPTLAPDVAFIPRSVYNVKRLMEFTRKYPYPKPGILIFSLPSYPTDGIAVIAYRRFWAGGGFAYLERTSEAWTVAGTSGWVE